MAPKREPRRLSIADAYTFEGTELREFVLNRRLRGRPNRRSKTQFLREHLEQMAANVLDGPDGFDFRFENGAGQLNKTKLARYLVNMCATDPELKGIKITFEMIRRSLTRKSKS